MNRWNKARAEMAQKSYDKDVQDRVRQLIECDEFVYQKVQDEGLVYGLWCVYMPDEATLDDYEDIASDDESYSEMLGAFARVVIADAE